MFKNLHKIKSNKDRLYNKIVFLSRNKFFYTRFGLKDTFQNRIILIFMHISFLFIKVKEEDGSEVYKKFYQDMFDFIFKKIELNMRELGYGDVSVNKNMKFLVKTFYNILLNCEKFNKKNLELKSSFLTKYLSLNNDINISNNASLVSYFDKYQTFCLDLTHDNVLKGELNFNYK